MREQVVNQLRRHACATSELRQRGAARVFSQHCDDTIDLAFRSACFAVAVQQLGELMLFALAQRYVGDGIEAQTLRLQVRGCFVEQRPVFVEARFELDLPVGDGSALALDQIVRRVPPAGELKRSRLGRDVLDRWAQRRQADKVSLGCRLSLYWRCQGAQIEKVNGSRGGRLDQSAPRLALCTLVGWRAW
jgi:hypothetical protein